MCRNTNWDSRSHYLVVNILSTGQTGEMKEDKQILDILHDNVQENKDKVFATWYNSKGKPTDQYTFAQIWDEAAAIAHDLRVRNKLNKGDRVILCYNFGLQFFAAFLGCLRSGIVAVPVYPPSPQNLPKALAKMNKIIEDSDAKLILLDDIANMIRLNPLFKSRNLWPQDINYKVHPKNARKPPLAYQSFVLNEILQENPITPSDLAFLQYTSGSTGDPKGVMITFKALHANVRGIVASASPEFENTSVPVDNVVGFSWLPQYHDMGLIYAIIAPFSAGWNCNMISPLDFIKNPLLWIDLMSRLKVNWTVAPNFAYRLAARKFIEAKTRLSASPGPKEPIPNLDLSSIIYLQNAAEPIQPDTRDLFQQAFGSYGLTDNWFGTGYGLAESVVYVTHLHEHRLSTFEPTHGQPVMAVGHRQLFPKGQVIKIVCPITFEELGDQQVGELWLSGPSIAAGYYGKPELTKEMFEAKLSNDSHEVFLRTGDLAFFENDYLYICGRQKDLIIVNGVNHYPQDIENEAQSASNAVRPGCVAAFSSNETGADGDLEVIFEIRKEFNFNAVDIVNDVRTRIINEIGIIPTRVVAIEERTILKTTSGKIQRKANRKALHDGAHKIVFEYDSKKTSGAGANAISQEQKEQLEKYDPFDRIMVSFFGMNFDATKTWEELGLASMASVSLRDKISDSFAITLDPDCFETHPTPDALKAFVLGNQGGALEVHLPLLRTLKNTNLPWSLLGFLQGLCSALLLLLFAISIVPAWFVGKSLANANAYNTVQALGTNDDTRWIWFPVAVPVWMLSLSLSVILLKWAVVGTYKEGIIPIPSLLYLRWWFIDRAVALWEFWVGRFIVNTPLINLFYFLMGAKVHWTVSIEAFIREFDLVEINQDTSLQFQIHCRKFGKWGKRDKPSIRFRRVSIGRNCTVRGMVSLGASVGDNSTVDKLSVVQKGAKVPQGTHVTGNPAYIIKEITDNPKAQLYSYGLLGLLKLSWLAFELYLFFATMLLGQFLWVSNLPQNWRYADLLKWTLLIVWFSISSIGTSVILKWVLIGKRRPGPVSKATLWRTFADWAADWHFEVGVGFLLSMTTNSRLWNVVLRLHGMDIDMASKVAGVGSFLPSKVDLIKVKNSFISVVTFSPKSNGCYHEIIVDNSSIGFLVHVGPDKNDVVISRSTVPPMTHVTSSIGPDKSDTRSLDLTAFDIARQETFMTLGYAASFGLLFCTLIPSYEFCLSIFGHSSSIWLAVPALVCALALQTLSWTFVFGSVQYLTLINSRKTGRPFSTILYSLYGTMAFAYQSYSFITALLGSPAFNFIMKLLGVQISGRALLFPHRMYECPYITIGDQTIVDGSHVTGHFVVYGNVTVGPCKVSGVLHEGCYASNTVITSEESESWRTFLGKPRGSVEMTMEMTAREEHSRESSHNGKYHDEESGLSSSESSSESSVDGKDCLIAHKNQSGPPFPESSLGEKDQFVSNNEESKLTVPESSLGEKVQFISNDEESGLNAPESSLDGKHWIVSNDEDRLSSPEPSFVGKDQVVSHSNGSGLPFDGKDQITAHADEESGLYFPESSLVGKGQNVALEEHCGLPTQESPTDGNNQVNAHDKETGLSSLEPILDGNDQVVAHNEESGLPLNGNDQVVTHNKERGLSLDGKDQAVAHNEESGLPLDGKDLSIAHDEESGLPLDGNDQVVAHDEESGLPLDRNDQAFGHYKESGLPLDGNDQVVEHDEESGLPLDKNDQPFAHGEESMPLPLEFPVDEKDQNVVRLSSLESSVDGKDQFVA